MAGEQVSGGHSGGAAAETMRRSTAAAAGEEGAHEAAAQVRGLSVSDSGMTLALRQTELVAR
jgi:hypothetical protein